MQYFLGMGTKLYDVGSVDTVLSNLVVKVEYGYWIVPQAPTYSVSVPDCTRKIRYSSRIGDLTRSKRREPRNSGVPSDALAHPYLGSGRTKMSNLKNFSSVVPMGVFPFLIIKKFFLEKTFLVTIRFYFQRLKFLREQFLRDTKFVYFWRKIFAWQNFFSIVPPKRFSWIWWRLISSMALH